MANFRFKKADLGVFRTKEAGHALNGFDSGCRIIGLTRGEFSLIDLIHATLKKTGPAHVVCTTWSAGIKDAHNVKWMMSTDLIQTFTLITDHSYSVRQKKYAISLLDLFGKENIRTSEIHAKFTLIHNKKYKVSIRTSMNLNANKTCESFEIDEDDEIFNFYMDFVKHTFGDMPQGFTRSNFKVEASLDRFFNTNHQHLSGWSEV